MYFLSIYSSCLIFTLIELAKHLVSLHFLATSADWAKEDTPDASFLVPSLTSL